MFDGLQLLGPAGSLVGRDEGGAAIMAAGGDEGAKGGGGEGKTYTWPRSSASAVLVMFAFRLESME